jgi:hypothetical protein
MLLENPSASADLITFNPVKALKVIVTTSAAERHWARAKDSTRLFQAIKEKLLAQGSYVAWRDATVHHGGDHKSVSRLRRCNLDLPAGDPGAAQISRWRSRLCVKTASGTRIDGQKLDQEIKNTLARCLSICEFEDEGFQHRRFKQRQNPNWDFHTPEKYIDLVREVFGGGIDLDPAPCPDANHTVQAKRFFTVSDNAFLRPWHAKTLFGNFPFAAGLHEKFVGKLIEEYRLGHVKKAIMLTSDDLSTGWFHAAFNASDSVCVLRNRIAFMRDGKKQKNPIWGNCFFFFGRRVERFERVFSRIGTCGRCSRVR